jgi:DNA-binding PadR family transcriptional regulator
MPEPTQPLAPGTFYILFALAGGDKHGYAIMREARTISEGNFEIGPATLYTTIQRLLESDWIAEIASPEESDSRRRYYTLTQLGKSALQGELQRMESMVRKSKALRLRYTERAV